MRNPSVIINISALHIHERQLRSDRRRWCSLYGELHLRCMLGIGRAAEAVLKATLVTAAAVVICMAMGAARTKIGRISFTEVVHADIAPRQAQRQLESEVRQEGTT